MRGNYGGIDYNTLRVLQRIPVGVPREASQEAEEELPEILKHPSANSSAIRRWREQQSRKRRDEAS